MTPLQSYLLLFQIIVLSVSLVGLISSAFTVRKYFKLRNKYLSSLDTIRELLKESFKRKTA